MFLLAFLLQCYMCAFDDGLHISACLSSSAILIAAQRLGQQARTAPLVSSSSSVFICAITSKMIANCKLCFFRVVCTILLVFFLLNATCCTLGEQVKSCL